MSLTPAMQQYMDVKNKHPDCIVLFRMGDFYETFFEDARLAAEALDITLTKRGHVNGTPIPLAGIPFHALEPYLAKLIKKGFKVAICEQTEDPKYAKGLVKRGLTRIVTPGTVIEDRLLEGSSNNYIACVYSHDGKAALSIADISTGEFFTYGFDETSLLDELSRFSPSEIIVPFTSYPGFASLKDRYFLTAFEDRHFDKEESTKTLLMHFNVKSLDPFELSTSSISACGALLKYLQETQKTNLGFINRIKRFNNTEYMQIDSQTQKNLEIFANNADSGKNGTLLQVLDNTRTPMGKRLIKKWLATPLLRPEAVYYRLAGVEELVKSLMLREGIKEILREISDIERLCARISYGSANARDIAQLRRCLQQIPLLKQAIADAVSPILKDISGIRDFKELCMLLESSIADEPQVSLREGGIIKDGYNSEVDELRELATGSRRIIQKIEEQEKAKTGIKSLKIKYNKVFGYFIEVSRGQAGLAPESYFRKQTTVNCERFITEELKDLESKVLNAEEKLHELEYRLFQDITSKVNDLTSVLQDAAQKIATLDVLVSFANASVQNNYCKPEMDSKFRLRISKGRHPVIEKNVEDFIYNDLDMDDDSRTFVITGPNMAGKSTFMRQNALMIIMAQIGCFVPAEKAVIGMVDRVFTRVGASDDISSGQSTFMMEMTQTALILNNATECSFVILDEIGRGTSTFDGMAIAWGVAEYITNTIRCKTLFATHYHTLNELSMHVKGIKNYNVAVLEEKERIVFLHKIIEGGTDKSYGIHVAMLAGLPREVIEQAKKVQIRFEKPNVKVVERINEDMRMKYRISDQKTLGGF